MTSIYYSSLEVAAKVRYQEKLTWKGCELPDPLDKEIRLRVFESNPKKWPEISFGDIYMYLVETHCWYTKEQFKCFKGLDGYNMFISGKVKEILVYRTKDLSVCLLTGDVEASQSIRKYHQPWILVEGQGKVLYAHCTCMAGLGEACSHVAAVLFAIETTIKLELHRPTSTSVRCKWKEIIKEVLPSTVVKMDFSRPSIEKRDKELASHQPERQNGSKGKKACPIATAEQITNLRKKLKIDMPNALLNFVFTDSEGTDTASENEEPQSPSISTTKLPSAPSILYYGSNVNNASHISLTHLEIVAIEEATREQSTSQTWTDQRVGRATASLFGRVFKCKSGQEGLVTEIMGYNKAPEFLDSLKWGHENEKKAIFAFTKLESCKHRDFIVSKCGLFVCSDKPFLGASPDGLVNCQCCEPAVLEVKCPSASKNMSISDACKKKIMYLNENLELNQKHEYFFQVQGQMAITKRNKAFFVVYTTVDIHIEVIMFDQLFWETAVTKIEQFFLTYILPEINQSSIKKKIISCKDSCICKGVKSGCCVTCSKCSKYFHLQCMKLKRTPKSWYCVDCSK